MANKGSCLETVRETPTYESPPLGVLGSAPQSGQTIALPRGVWRPSLHDPSDVVLESPVYQQ